MLEDGLLDDVCEWYSIAKILSQCWLCCTWNSVGGKDLCVSWRLGLHPLACASGGPPCRNTYPPSSEGTSFGAGCNHHLSQPGPCKSPTNRVPNIWFAWPWDQTGLGNNHIFFGLQKLLTFSMPILFELAMPNCWYCSNTLWNKALHLSSCVPGQPGFITKSKQQFAMVCAATPSSRICKQSYAKLSPTTPGSWDTKWSVGHFPACLTTVPLHLAVARKSLWEL